MKFKNNYFVAIVTILLTGCNSNGQSWNTTYNSIDPLQSVGISIGAQVVGSAIKESIKEQKQRQAVENLDRRFLLEGCQIGTNLFAMSYSDCHSQGGVSRQKLVADCMYDDGGRAITTIEKCVKRNFGTVVAVYESDFKQEIKVKSSYQHRSFQHECIEARKYSPEKAKEIEGCEFY